MVFDTIKMTKLKKPTNQPTKQNYHSNKFKVHKSVITVC